MSKRTGRKPKRERTSKRRARRHSSTSDTSSEDVPSKTRVSTRVDDAERKVALTIKLPKPDANDCGEENTTGMWKVECSNGSDGDIQKLKISLRRSPKDLLREQAAEEKRKEKEAASCSTNSSVMDGSVTSYLEQFGSTMEIEDTEQNIVDSNEQVQVVIPANEPPCKEDNTSQIDNTKIDSSETLSEFITTQEREEPDVENTFIDNKSIDEVVCEAIVEANEIQEDIKEPLIIAVESIKQFTTSEDISEHVHPPAEELQIAISPLEEQPVYVAEVVSSDVVGAVSLDVDIPVAISENIKEDVEQESIKSVVIESNTSETLEEENVQAVAINIIANEELNKVDVMNDSEQMEDVVQLTVESPDLVDDEDPKPVDEEEPKSVYEEEHIKLAYEEPKLVNEEGHKIVDEEKIKPVEESYSLLSSDIYNSKQIDVGKELKSDDTHTLFETPKPLSSHFKRKWGSCKTRTPIMISPFTLGTVIESNGDFFGDNGEYRSEGEIQGTDSEEEEQYIEDTMEMNDTMLIDHEAVDYEAPEDEEKPDIDDNDDSKSDKTLVEEIVNVEPKKKSSVKRIATTSVIRITNLVRPFTVGQLRDLLQRTGKIVSNGFWIDTIKSQCIVEYENEDQAIETVYALNESQWPSTNPKFLRVVFTDKEELHKALNGTHPDQLNKQKDPKVEKLKTQLDNNIILREWDRGKLEDINGEKDDKSIKRKMTDDSHIIKGKKLKKDEKDVLDKRRKSKSKTAEHIPTKSLDELFKKTKTSPTLYWSPLSTEQIAEKEDQRRKHLAEMERSQKTDRRRRNINNFPRRR